ncbi:MAG: DUF5703 domain-containing protein [Planctomycetota bacterium]
MIRACIEPLGVLVVALSISVHAITGEPPRLADYNVVWTTPSHDASGSMPLGNGDISLNVWFEEKGDLVFYIGKMDTWDDNGRLLKVGKVRFSLEPFAMGEATSFTQTLDLQSGEVRIIIARKGAGTAPGATTLLRVWVDASHPVIHATVEGAVSTTVTATIELWRTERAELPSIEVSDVLLDRSKPNGQHSPTIVEPDTILTDLGNRVGWYHHNVKSVGPELTMRIQGLLECLAVDPLLHRTFGAVVTAEGGERVDDRTLRSPPRAAHRFSIYVLTRHPSTGAAWLEAMDGLITATERTPFAERRAAHDSWWTAFWDRSWIHARETQAAPPALITPNNHPVCLGIDQAGGNRFQGTLGRVSVLERVLSPSEIAALARDSHDALELDCLVGSWVDVAPGKALRDLAERPFGEPLTLEAWIEPGTLPAGGGRIIDKIAPGIDDGFLLDTHPGNSLRLITTVATLRKENCLTPGRWQHVAATIDPGKGELRLFLDGAEVASETVETASDAFVVSRAYHLQRFINACAGRGHYPIKFNGSILTVPSPGGPGDADYRRWGPGYWWQNTRLPYISMCTSGDFDLMQSLFRMYSEELLEVSKARTLRYCGHEGAFIPECVYFWGAIFSETYGWTPAQERGDDKLQESRWHKWEWVSGLELTWMMQDYYEHTLDAVFLRDKLLPVAHEVLTFFDRHYKTDAQGRLVMHPAQALETWWDCTNPMPELVGLRAVTQRLQKLPESLTTPDQRAFWSQLEAKLPPLPLREVDGVRMLAPAERFAAKSNIENPELYAVFPFRLIAVGKPDYDLALQALRHREDRGNFGWRQDDIFMAYLGLASEAKEYLSGRARSWDRNSRFPAFWGPNYDWVPDQDHGGVLMKTLQALLIQTEGETIHLLPAWPKKWDVDFKVHAPKRTVLRGTVQGGRLEKLEVTPAERRKDVVLAPSW